MNAHGLLDCSTRVQTPHHVCGRHSCSQVIGKSCQKLQVLRLDYCQNISGEGLKVGRCCAQWLSPFSSHSRCPGIGTRAML